MQYNSCNIQLYSIKTSGYKTGSVIRYIGATREYILNHILLQVREGKMET